ncbi:MAG: DUF3560 domain-containing protein [Chitinophagaceae bacterium]|nr:MAG: DUF3560 domain-containing protein [Chitinophagaceae bacterium]
MKHNFEQRKQNRIDHANEQAAKNEQKAAALYNHAREMASAIPFGQPILVGHHSEQRDRNYRNKIHNTFGKSFEAQDKAAYYENKAETIENNNAIFSDDPQAIEKLQAKLTSLQDAQAFMKAANKCIKKQDKTAFLQLPFATEKLWEQLNTPDYVNRTGFAGYSLQNNNANIARVKKRLAFLEKQAEKITRDIQINGVRLVENTEANRVQLFFPGIPAEETRKKLKQNGFRWCKSEGAWQRHLTPWAVRIAHDLLQIV